MVTAQRCPPRLSVIANATPSISYIDQTQATGQIIHIYILSHHYLYRNVFDTRKSLVLRNHIHTWVGNDLQENDANTHRNDIFWQFIESTNKIANTRILIINILSRLSGPQWQATFIERARMMGLRNFIETNLSHGRVIQAL